MTRKEFLLTACGGTAGLLATLGLAKCSSDPTGPGATTQKAFTSTSSNSHTHTVTIQQTEMQSTPSGGISKMTSSSNGHSHSFSMTQAQMQSCMGGMTVTITSGVSSSGGDHTHDFMISRWF